MLRGPIRACAAAPGTPLRVPGGMLRLLLIAGLAVCLGACTATGGLFGSRHAAPAGGSPKGDIDTQGLGVYLNLMHDLVQGDAVDQADIFRRVQQDEKASPTTTNRLKLALALAVPNHPSANAQKAADQLRALLAEDDALLPQERVLATIELNDVERRLVLDQTAQDVKHDAEAKEAKQSSEQAERLKAALEENRKLKSQLKDAMSKLDAITTIEQSIRKHENAPD